MTIYNRPSADVPVWAEAGDKVQPTSPEVQIGWPASNIPPSRQRFNWLLNFLANAVRYVMQRGIPEWSADEDYPAGARIQFGGATYRAKTANSAKQPDTSAAEWERWGYADTEIQPRVDKLLTKSVAGSSNVTLTADEAGCGVLVFTGALTGNISIIVPNASRRWVVHNGTSGSYKLSVKTASGPAVEIPQSTTKSVVIYCDAANNVRLAGSANDAAIQVLSYTATAGQTVFDATYVPGAVFMVVRNGASVGFTASNGSTVVLDVAASLNDVVKVYVASGFQVSDAVSKGGDTMTGPLTLSGNATANLHAVPKQQLDNVTQIASEEEARAFSGSKLISSQRLGDALKGDNQSLAASGYQKLPGGLMFQWGASGNLAPDGSATVTFSTPFPNACLRVMVSIVNSTNSNDDVFARIISYTATSVTVRAEFATGAASVGTRYIEFFAIGY